MPANHFALVEPAGGWPHADFPTIGFGATYGMTWDGALRQAEDMLEEAVRGLIAHGEETSEPIRQNGATAGDTTRRAPITPRRWLSPSSAFTAQ